MTKSSEHHNEGDEAARRDADRVIAEYRRRAVDESLRGYYDRNLRGIERASDERRALMLEQIDRLGPRHVISILDVGCGTGDDLAFFADQGFAPALLAGIDLIAERVVLAAASVPKSDVRVANATALPYADQSFDVVLQSVVLSSVTDGRVRAMIAGEMARVVRSEGLLISYDMRTVRGGDSELVAIDESEVRRLFGQFGRIDLRTLTLHIGLVRRVGPIAARTLARIPLLRTHLLAVVTRATRV